MCIRSSRWILENKQCPMVDRPRSTYKAVFSVFQHATILNWVITNIPRSFLKYFPKQTRALSYRNYKTANNMGFIDLMSDS